MNYPKISIITPSYNQGEFLESTIKSVLNQGYPNLEYIIIDGGSTDNSVEIIKRYEKQLAYWVSEKDEGQADAINKGIDRSTGDILGWINSDDVYLKGIFLKVVQSFKKRQDCIVVHGNRVMIDVAGNVIGWNTLPAFNPTKHCYTVCSETAFWRRQAMDEVGKLKAELQFAMDLEFFCRLYLVGKFTKLDQPLGGFRCYPNNKTSTMWHIGQAETEKEWGKLFGVKNTNWRLAPKVNIFTHRIALLKHFRTIGLPYMLYRLYLLRSSERSWLKAF